MNCPNCGFKLDPRPGKLGRLARAYGGYRQKRITTMNNTAMVPWQPVAAGDRISAFTEAERRTPTRPQNLESDFLTPLAQALATGCFIGIGGIYGAWLYPGVIWYHGLAAGVVAAGAHWIIATFWNRNLLWTVERIINTDINQDGDIGQPAPSKIEVEVKEGGTRTILDLFTDPNNPSIVNKFIQAVADNETAFSERGAAKVGYSAELFKELRDEFVRRGVAYWKHPTEKRQGVELSVAGRAMLRELARLPYPTA